MSNNPLHHGFEALVEAADVETLRQVTQQRTEGLGFAYFAYALQIDFPLSRPAHFVFSGFPHAWVRRYEEQNYFACDPVLSEAGKDVLPVIWRDRHFRADHARQLWDEARDFGICHGLSVSLREKPGLAGVFSLARDRVLGERGSDLAALIGNAQLLASLLHAAIARLELPHLLPQAGVRLTGRERECLKWAGDGKTAWEIGQILNVSERTAVFHLNNCVQKLGATNKMQAVVQAMSLGLLRAA